MKVHVAFADHVDSDGARMVLGFLNALTGATAKSGQRTYEFTFARQGKLAHARPTLDEWARDGILHWEERN